MRTRRCPITATTLDDAAFRTLETMARASRVFGLERATIIADDFHEADALLFLFGPVLRLGGCRLSLAIRVPRVLEKTRCREVASRFVAWLDVPVPHTQPRFCGPREAITVARS